jgi:hypothetical protein
MPYFNSSRLIGVCRDLRAEVAAALGKSLAELSAAASDAGLPIGGGATALLAAQATRYGAVYWLTRYDAERALLVGECQDGGLLNAFGEWFEQTDVLHRLWHAAVKCFIVHGPRRRVLDDRYVPPGGFQPLGGDGICLRRVDLADLLGDASQTKVFDLHDFAHQAAASLSGELYGNRLHSAAFAGLPEQLIDLVAGFASTRTPQHSDGTVFAGYLGHLFNEHGHYRDPEWIIASELADLLLPYMLGEGALYLPSAGQTITPSRSVNVVELAMLAANKAYEAPASELEQLMFTRGGSDGRDELQDMTTAERVYAIASLRDRTFHEARNTLKHRAQAIAYERTLEQLWRHGNLDADERALALATIRHLRFEDFRLGRRRDLFADVAAYIDAGAGAELGEYPCLPVQVGL